MHDAGMKCRPPHITFHLLAPFTSQTSTNAGDYDVFPFTPSQLLTVTNVVPVVVPEDMAGTGDGDIGIDDIGTTVVGTAPIYTVGTGVKLSARNALMSSDVARLSKNGMRSRRVRSDMSSNQDTTGTYTETEQQTNNYSTMLCRLHWFAPARCQFVYYVAVKMKHTKIKF